MPSLSSKMHPTPTTGADVEKAKITAQQADETYQQPTFRLSMNNVEVAIIRIVHVSLIALIVVTTGLSILFHCEPHAMEFLKQLTGLLFWIIYGLASSMILIPTLIMAITKLTKARRLPWRWNVFLIGVFIVSESFLIALYTSGFKCDELFLAVVICALVYLDAPLKTVLLLTKWKISTWGYILYAFLLALVLVILDIFILPNSVILFCCCVWIILNMHDDVVSKWVI